MQIAGLISESVLFDFYYQNHKSAGPSSLSYIYYIYIYILIDRLIDWLIDWWIWKCTNMKKNASLEEDFIYKLNYLPTINGRSFGFLNKKTLSLHHGL